MQGLKQSQGSALTKVTFASLSLQPRPGPSPCQPCSRSAVAMPLSAGSSGLALTALLWTRASRGTPRVLPQCPLCPAEEAGPLKAQKPHPRLWSRWGLPI